MPLSAGTVRDTVRESRNLAPLHLLVKSDLCLNEFGLETMPNHAAGALRCVTAH